MKIKRKGTLTGLLAASSKTSRPTHNITAHVVQAVLVDVFHQVRVLTG